MSGPTPGRLLTVGHGTASQTELAALLRDAGVTAVVDVRRHPGSRRHPHFAREALTRWLPEAGMGYRWEEALGGRRRGRSDSPHEALRNASFRAYADHMGSPVWRRALSSLLQQAGEEPVAVMCSESLWWRCHRRLIADVVMLVAGWEVGHLLHDGRVGAHRLTDGARRVGDGVVYDGGAGGQTLFQPAPEEPGG